MSKPKLLDLFSGAGGAARGYHDAGFEVVGVDLAPQPHYPFEFHQADALTYPLEGFDVIHASPVCKGYTVLNSISKQQHPKLIPDVRMRLLRTGRPYIIENVEGARQAMRNPITLCGSMFGLAVKRHRLFESNILLFEPGPCVHGESFIGIYGHSVWDTSQRGTIRKDGRPRPDSVPADIGRLAMGIPWMNKIELAQAIPPAYTEWVGLQLLSILESVEVAG